MLEGRRQGEKGKRCMNLQVKDGGEDRGRTMGEGSSGCRMQKERTRGQKRCWTMYKAVVWVPCLHGVNQRLCPTGRCLQLVEGQT